MSTHRIELELSADLYKQLRQRIDSGEYASESAAIEAALFESVFADVSEPAEGSMEPGLAAELCSAYDDDLANSGAGLTPTELDDYLAQQRLQRQNAG